MAAVLDALAPYVINMIKDMSEEELRMLLGVSVEIKKLGDRLENLQAYLADAERRRINEARVQRWVSKLKGALYEATDILELCQLDARKRRGGWWATMEDKAPDCLCLRPLLFFLRNPGFAHGMGGRIKELNERLDHIKEEMAEFRFEPGSFPERTRPSDATPCSRTTTSLIDESAIVGDKVEEDAKSLVRVLLSDEPAATIMVVSIVGPGGIGKTTLAKKIFNDEDIKAAFGSKIWLSVTEIYDELSLLSSAITQAAGVPRGSGDKEVLTQGLASTLSSKGKFLLVLDDVWSDGPWTGVLQGPAVEAARKHLRSRVIITTRNKELVKTMGAAHRQHHVKPMDDEDAWSLLKKQFPPQDVGSAVDHLKDIGMGIIRNCGGLPLAIKAIGGLLRTKGATEQEWKSVLHDPAWKTDRAHHDLNKALQLSYEDLSPALKQCFLYYSLIPKGLMIFDEDIIDMWMSEGFIISEGPAGDDDDGSLNNAEEEYNLGLFYYRSLLKRNLIEPHGTSLDGSCCVMHDVIRSFAQYMAKEEALVIRPGGHHRQQQLLSSTKFRRICIESTEAESEPAVLPEWNIISGKQELLRSLIINGRMKFEPEDSSSLNKQFPSLRVLFVRHAESERFVESLAKLKHLRFLRLENSDISRLPDDMCNKMKFLEYLHIRNCASFSGELPRSIIKLQRLRDLSLLNTKFTVPKGFSGLTNLRRLNVFPVQTDGEWCSLQELGPLSGIRFLAVRGLEQVPVPASGSSAAAKAKIHEKEQLRMLTLYCNSGEEVQRRVEDVFDELRPPRQLGILVLNNYLGRRTPSWLAAAGYLNTLTTLAMLGLPFCTQLPDGLCKLPSLEILIIDYAPEITRVGPEVTGTSSSSFPRLQHLWFCRMPNWEQWQWEEEADYDDMPFLQRLFIKDCKLVRLPSGLASSKRTTLRELWLEDAAMITAVENFPSVEMLSVNNCPSLKIIRGFPKMQVVVISSCPALEVLEGGSALHTLELADPGMVTLPEYLRGLKLRLLRLTCHQSLCDLLLSSNESDRHILAEKEKVRSCEKTIVFYPPPPSSDTADGQRRAFQVIFSSTGTVFSSMHERVFSDSIEGRLASAMRDYRRASARGSA